MKKIIAALVVAACVQSARADLLVSWDFAGLSGVTSGSVTSNLASVDMVDTSLMLVSRGSGLTAASNTGGYSANNWTTGASLDADDYFEWNLAADAGFQFSVTSIVMNVRRTGATAPSTFELRSSADSYASSIATLINSGTTTSNFVINLAGPLVASETYRLYGYNASSTAGNANFGGTGTDLAVFGTVVPEPTSVALLGLGLIAFCYRRKHGV